MSAAAKAHRGTIHLSDAEVIRHTPYEGDQFILTVKAPECARTAKAGSFAHIQCDNDIPMRRPLSIMRANAASGEVEFLYKIVGAGLRALSHARPGDQLSVLGPIGNGFSPDPARPHKLMIGGGVGIPPMVFLAEQLTAQGVDLGSSLVLMGSEVPFPFTQSASGIEIPGIPDGVTNAMPDLENIGVPSRLASLQGYAGCFQGYITDLAAEWLKTLTEEELGQVEVFACGPEPMLEAAGVLVRRFGLPCQLCLEEFMACAVGGCAGCTVPVYSNGEMAMKRVCVDGPVFAANTIYPE
ncbi:MAG: dihydroorotate dehydrogenase electron transfer subunit [Gammaproteobacteria bacterium]